MMVRYSFHVGLLHPLSDAGLSRRFCIPEFHDLGGNRHGRAGTPGVQFSPHPGRPTNRPR